MTITLATTITINDSGQSSDTIASSNVTPNISFDVVLSNPCPSTSLADISFSSGSISVTDGDTGQVTFSVPATGVDSVNSVKDLCGPQVYTIKDSNGDTITSYASITPSTSTARQMVLTIDTTQYPTHITSDVSETLTVEVTLADYVGNAGNTNS